MSQRVRVTSNSHWFYLCFGVFCYDARVGASIISIKHLVSEEQCYDTIQRLRWQDGVHCPHCDSGEVVRRGYDGPERHLRRYACRVCGRCFDDLAGTALSGHHQPLSVWVLCLHFGG